MIERMTDVLRAAYTLDQIRDAIGSDYQPPAIFRPSHDALLRRVAERLPLELVGDVVALIKLARGSP